MIDVELFKEKLFVVKALHKQAKVKFTFLNVNPVQKIN